MTRTRPEIHAPMLVLGLFLAGCASTPPPTGLLADAERAVGAARDARADELSPVEMGHAEERMAAARQAMDEGDYALARSQAEQAEVNAALATARSRAAAGRAAVRRQSEENQRLPRLQALDRRQRTQAGVVLERTQGGFEPQLHCILLGRAGTADEQRQQQHDAGGSGSSAAHGRSSAPSSSRRSR